MKRPSTINQIISHFIPSKTLTYLIVFFLFLINSKIFAQLPDSILCPTDTNYFQITSKVDAYLNSLPSPGSGSMGSGSGGSGSSTIEEDGWEANYYKWKSYWENKIDNNGNFNKYYKQIDLYSSTKNSYKNKCNGTNLSENLKWKCIGPFNSPVSDPQQQGQVDAISVNPTNLNEILLGTLNGGIWRTTNGGTDWHNTTDGSSDFDNQGSTSIERMTSNPNIVFANTVKNSVGRWVTYSKSENISKGILKSVDGGETWSTIPLLTFLYQDEIKIPQILVHPSSLPNAAYIFFIMETKYGTTVNLYDESHNVVIEVFTSLELNYKNAVRIEINPSNPNLIYVSTKNQDYHVNSAKLYRKTISLTPFFTSSSLLQQDYSSLNTLCSSCGFVDNASLSYITFSFSNNGKARELLHCGTIDIYAQINDDLSFVSGQVFSHPANFRLAHPFFEVSPANDNIIYKEDGTSPCRSINGGNTFSSISSGIAHADTRCFEVVRSKIGDPLDFVYCGNDGGICKSTTGGNSWSIINGYGLNIGEYYGLGGTEQDCKYIRAGAQDGNLTQFRNNEWTHEYSAGDNGEQIIQPDNLNHIRFSGNFHYFENWTSSCSSLIVGEFGNWGQKNFFRTFPFTLSKLNNNRVFIGFENLHYRDESSSTPICDDVIWTNSQNNQITAVETAFDGGEDVVFVSTKEYTVNWPTPRAVIKGGIWRINKTGTSWTSTEITNNLRALNVGPLENSCQINDIVVDPNNINNIWVCFGGLYADAANSSITHKVYKTTNGGITWTNYSEGLPNLPTYTIEIQKGTNNRLYLGTDIGLYYRDASMNCWVKYGKDVPDFMIYDIDINYCGKLISVASFGKGIWQVPLIPENDIIISSNLDWNNDQRNIYANLHITKDPITLTPTTLKITNGSIINMAKGTRIIIDQGCKLLVDNSTITNECNTMWEGIVVRGDKMNPQELTSTDNTTNLSPIQGFVYLNNATISYAREAIRLWNPEQEWVSANQIDNQGESGGIVIAENSTFINNRRSVEIMWYKNYDWTTGIEKPNVSTFKQCTFKVTDDYRTDYPFYAHVSMWDNRGINYKACTFANNKTNSSVYENKGMGIISIDANYTVENIGALKSQFKNLTYGVNVINSQKGATSVNIIKSAFNKNQIGAYLLNANQSIVSGNSIWLGRITNDVAEPDINIIGIGFNQSGQFTNKDNIFSGYNIAGASAYTVGEWFINNSLTSNPENISFGNKFSKIPWASYANYYNRKDIDRINSGLQFKCNKNENNIHDFYSWSGTSTLADAGIRDNQGNMTSYAGNTFSAGSSAVFAQFNHNEANHINYYVSVLGASDAPNLTKVDGNTSVIQNLSTTPVCPIKIFTPPTTPIEPQGNVLVNGMGWIETDDKTKLTPTERTNAEIAFINHKNAYQSYITQFNELIDAGNTNELLTQINTSTASNSISALRTELLGASPYLSQTVLEATVSNNTIPFAILLEILSANPDAGKNQKIIDKLIELNTPQYILDYIQNNIGTINTKLLLESSISEEHEQMMKFHQMIIQDILNDPIAINHNEYRGWLGQLNTVEADYEIVDDYISLGQYTDASEFMSDILNNYSLDKVALDDYNDLLAFNNWKIEALTSTSSIQHLDNNRIESLQAFANNGGRLSKERAQSIINYFYDGTFQTTPEFPTENNQRKANPYLASTKTNEPSYTRVYPNPAKDLVFFEYLLPCNDNEAILEIRDLSGKLILQTTIDKSLRQYTLNIDKYVSGNYIYKIICGGTVFGKGQISVIK